MAAPNQYVIDNGRTAEQILASRGVGKPRTRNLPGRRADTQEESLSAAGTAAGKPLGGPNIENAGTGCEVEDDAAGGQGVGVGGGGVFGRREWARGPAASTSRVNAADSRTPT